MIKITQNDLQYIKDENTLIRFLKEKLNIPIPEGLTIEDISSKYSNYSLGLSETDSKHVLDCQELSISPGQSSGIFLIRFNSETGYDGVLHAISKRLVERRYHITDLRYFCIDKHYQLFAFAYHNNSMEVNGDCRELNILVWKQDNAHIHIASEHDIPDTFFYDVSKDSNKIMVQISTEVLLDKIDKIGTPLSTYWEIHKGIDTGCNDAYVIDDNKRQQLIDNDHRSEEIIKLKVGKYQKNRWIPEMKYLIWIPSSKHKKWPWSDTKNEPEAEKIFAQTYPAIFHHLSSYKSDLKSRRSCKGRFYWELSQREHNHKFLGPKICFYDKPPIIAYYDESDAIVVNSFVHCVPTKDVFLLAIFNSKLFEWYSQHRFNGKGGFRLNKTNVMPFRIVGTESQKISISRLVQQILDNNNSPDIPDLEEEIDQLVYELYDLTPAEIKLIEKETDQ